MAGGYEVLGNFLADQAGLIRADTNRQHNEKRADALRQHDEDRQERLIKEGRDYSHATKLEDEKRAYADGLIAQGLLSPEKRDDPAAVADAWSKTTPEYKVEFKEKLDLRDEIKKYTAEGMITDVQIFGNDVDTLRSIAAAAREQGGKQAAEQTSLKTDLAKSQIAENIASSHARLGGEERARNAAFWTQEANAAYQEYENAQLGPDEIKQAQVIAANSPGAETSPDLFQAAMQKASEALLSTKRKAAYLRAQNAQAAARVGAAIPQQAAAPSGAPGPGASVGPVDPNAKIQGFLQQQGGGAPGPGASVAPAAVPSDGPGLGSTIVTGASMLPLERLAPLARLGSGVPLARAGVMGYQLGNSINSMFPNNPLARVGNAAGTDAARIMGVLPGPQDYRRPLPGSSVGNPYQ